MICGSASKAYAMTGWRCGWPIGPAAVIAASNAIQSHSTSNVTSITQKAAVAALTGSQAPVTAMLDEYRKRRDQPARLADRRSAAALPRSRPARSTCSSTSATRCRRDGFRTSIDFAEALLEEQRVAVTPGEAFDAPGFVRISYATSMELCRKAARGCSSSSRKHAPQHVDGRLSAADSQRMTKVVAVIGASSNRNKFGNRAVRAFQQQGYTVVPINPHEAEVEGLKAYASVLDVPGADRHGVVLRAAGDRRCR